MQLLHNGHCHPSNGFYQYQQLKPTTDRSINGSGSIFIDGRQHGHRQQPEQGTVAVVLEDGRLTRHHHLILDSPTSKREGIIHIDPREFQHSRLPLASSSASRRHMLVCISFPSGLCHLHSKSPIEDELVVMIIR